MSRADELATFGSALLLVLCAPAGAAQVASMGAIRKCPVSIEDMATQACLEASSIPTLGMLVPLGPELFVDALGNVGMGTIAPSARLAVVGWIESTSGGVRFPDGTQQSGAAWGGAQGWTPGQVATLAYRDGGVASIPEAYAHVFGVFDGEHVWMGTVDPAFGSGTVLTKFRASDGEKVGEYGTWGNSVLGLAFDGAHLWVLNYYPAGGFHYTTLAKVRASDGQIVQTIPFGASATYVDYSGVVFDGTHIWVAHTSTDEVLRIRTGDGAILETVPVGDRPSFLAIDGQHLWVSNYDSDDVTKIRTADGVVLGTFGVGYRPWSLEFDGDSVWVANTGSSNVTKLRAVDGALMGTYAVGAEPRHVVFDGTSVWTTYGDGSSSSPAGVTRLRARDGAFLGDFTFPVGAYQGAAVFDGIGMWFSHTDFGTQLTDLRRF